MSALMTWNDQVFSAARASASRVTGVMSICGCPKSFRLLWTSARSAELSSTRRTRTDAVREFIAASERNAYSKHSPVNFYVKFNLIARVKCWVFWTCGKFPEEKLKTPSEPKKPLMFLKAEP